MAGESKVVKVCFPDKCITQYIEGSKVVGLVSNPNIPEQISIPEAAKNGQSLYTDKNTIAFTAPGIDKYLDPNGINNFVREIFDTLLFFGSTRLGRIIKNTQIK